MGFLCGICLWMSCGTKAGVKKATKWMMLRWWILETNFAGIQWLSLAYWKLLSSLKCHCGVEAPPELCGEFTEQRLKTTPKYSPLNVTALLHDGILMSTVYFLSRFPNKWGQYDTGRKRNIFRPFHNVYKSSSLQKLITAIKSKRIWLSSSSCQKSVL